MLCFRTMAAVISHVRAVFISVLGVPELNISKCSRLCKSYPNGILKDSLPLLEGSHSFMAAFDCRLTVSAILSATPGSHYS